MTTFDVFAADQNSIRIAILGERIEMTPNAKANNSASIVIREIGGPEEMRAVEQIQKEVWGLPDLDVVPLTQLIAAKASGGILIGAFEEEKLVGFAYGFVGLEEGRATHHSHMLAVAPTHRDHNLGHRLKLAQRDIALSQGIIEMTWTFDPLQSLNAHFNFHRLGVVSNRYFVDFYGTDAASFLHRNGTDRLLVTWELASRRVEERIAGMPSEVSLNGAVPLVEAGEGTIPEFRDLSTEQRPEKLFIEIPTRIEVIESERPAIAREWRVATRRAFVRAFESGYRVVDFVRGDRSGKYILDRRLDGR